MNRWITAGFCFLWIQVLAAKDAEIPGVEQAIPAAVKQLSEPEPATFPHGIEIAVSTHSDTSQEHVRQGLNHLHGGWEFEASRHFAASMKEDPECLLAHWGMVMCLLNPTPETREARLAAIERLLFLLEQGKGTELERGYAYGLVKYLEEGPAQAAEAFRKVSKRFPNDRQSVIFTALFQRGGYDESGDPTPSQEDAELALLNMVKAHPEDPLPLHALLLIRAEAPNLSFSQAMAQDLCKMNPDYPPYRHLLGHYQWRSGLFTDATASFTKSSAMYQDWLIRNKATIADCPEWIRAESYRITSLVSQGKTDEADAAATRLAATPVPENRTESPGARLLLWDAKTLPARIRMFALDQDRKHKDHLLPSPEETKKIRQSSHANWWIDGLRITWEARRSIASGKMEEAATLADALAGHIQSMSATRKSAGQAGERSEWNRAIRALEILNFDLRGRMAMAGPKERASGAYNWFSSAADRQSPAPLLMPPWILTPMKTRRGEYQLSANHPEGAESDFKDALRDFPNDLHTLRMLKHTYETSGKTKEAAEISAKIDKIQNGESK